MRPFYYGFFPKKSVQFVYAKKKEFYDPSLLIGANPMEHTSRPKAIEIELGSLWTKNKTVSWLIMGFILLALAVSAHAQADQNQVAFNSKVKNEFSKPLSKKQTAADFSDANLSAQQMIDFFKNEQYKLNKEISEFIKKVNPNPTGPLSEDESDMLHVAILKNKLEYFEVILKKWANEGDF
jgi:hypothetical protein